jgi:HSP20 family protein
MIRRRRRFNEILPFGWELEQIMEDLFEEPMWDVSRHEMRPLTHVRETDVKIIVSVDLPYVKKENIQLNVAEDSVEICATMDRCIRYDRWGTVQRDCEFRSYRTAVALPTKVIPEGATARFKSGVLEVEVPKKTQRHKITIQ